MNDFRARIQSLQARLCGHDAAAFALLAGTDQMRYLSGWREGGHERFVGLFIPAKGDPVFVVPSMNVAQATKTPAEIARVIGWADSTGWINEVESLLRECGALEGVALIDDELHSGHLIVLQERIPSLRYRAAGETMARLRELKTDDELISMLRAAEMIDSIFEESLSSLRAGMTELDFAEIIKSLIRREGSSPSFDPLICFGANAANPHHHTGPTTLERGDVVIIDIGCTSEHYASDITRTVSFGAPSDSLAIEIYRIVYEAHHAARQIAAPGKTGAEIDNAARKVITAAGYGAQFLHRTGHGIGLSTHEPPYIVQGNDRALESTTCFSIEPGIYLSGRFGVRIENIVTLETTGVRSLNAEPPNALRIVD